MKTERVVLVAPTRVKVWHTGRPARQYRTTASSKCRALRWATGDASPIFWHNSKGEVLTCYTWGGRE